MIIAIALIDFLRNDRGNVLAVSQGDRTGLLGKSREVAKQVDVTQAPYFQLIKVALQAIKKDNCYENK